MEVEVKLRLPDAATHQRLSDALAPHHLRTHLQENLFFDGAAGQLTARLAVLRLRFYDGDSCCILSLKARPRVTSASFPDSTLFAPSQTSLPNPPFHPPPQPVGLDTLGHQAPEIFPESVGASSFTGLMPAAATSLAVLGFNFSDPPPIQLGPQQSPSKAAATVAEEIRMPGIMDLPPFQGRSGGGDGHTGLEWTASVDPSLFDLTSAVDPGAYWNQSHWNRSFFCFREGKIPDMGRRLGGPRHGREGVEVPDMGESCGGGGGRRHRDGVRVQHRFFLFLRRGRRQRRRR